MTPVGTEGTNAVAASDRTDGRRTPSAVLIPERLAGTRVRGSKHQRQQEDLDETKYNDFFSSPLRHSQPAVLDVSSYSTRFPSTRVRIPGVLEEDNIEHQLTIDSATDIPCISKTFIDKHEKLRQKCIFPIPPGAISLRSADGSPLQILGYIRFTLKLGNKSLPVEALVLPHLGPDIMLLDNSIMKSFGAKLDWLTECLSFQDSLETIPARHVKSPVQSKYCSIITQTVDTLPTPVLVSRKVVIPAAHEALIRVFSTARPEKDTLALIEPRIASIHTLDDMPQDDIWQSVIIARTVTQWSKVTNSALLQVGNPSDRNIILKPNTIVGTITPVTAISPRTASAVTQNCSESSQARIDLTAALDESFKNTTFGDQQRAQIINLCTEYRSVFSLNQKELGKCTIAEAEFPLQKDTKPVDRHPYRTNPRAQEVIDKCVDDTPTTIKELRSVLGTVNFVRKFIPNLATIIEPLVALTRKSVANLKTLRNIWGPEQDAAFIKVKELLTSAPVLHFPRFHKPFIIHVDASDCGVGAFLAQKDDNGELAIIAYFSKRFTSSQQHYSATQKECLAVVLAVTHWRPYIWGRHFVCVTDHSALRYLYSMQDTSNMLTRWAIALQSYDFTVEHKPGKLNIIPDTLSRLFSFEHSEMRVAPHLAPICRNVPDNPALHGPHILRPYQVNSHNLDEIQPVESDREPFTSATDVFMSIDPEKLRQAQQAEFGPYFEYLCDPKKRPPSNESRTSMSYYSENGGLLYRSYLPGHLRKRSTFRDQLVIPSACISMVLHACHDHAMSGGHLAYKHTFDKVRDRFWWPTLHRDVKTWCQDCQACQRRKTPHRGPKLPTGHLPVDRPFQRVSIDLVEYKTESVSPTGLKCSYALTIIDHLTRFSVLVALPDKKEQTIAKALVERVFGIFGPPETLHSDQGPEFENKVVKQLQDVFGYKKTKTTPYRPQGNSVSERMHSTLHAMLSMYSNIAQNNWAEVLPFIQLAHNTSFSSTMHETPFFLMFGRQARLPIDIIFGIPHVGKSATTEEFAHATRENLQIAFELARRNLSERIEKQKADNSKLPPEFTPGQKVLIYKPHHSTDGPNPKLIQPWRGPYIICSKLSPVVYRIRHPDDTKQVSVHLAHIKSYRPRQSAPAPDFHKLEGLFLGKTLPTPALEESETVPPHIGIYQVADVVGHRRGQGRHSPHNYIYRLRLKGFGPEADLEYRAHQVPQCQELIAAYRAQHQLETITPPPCNKRKHPASKDGNSPGSDTAPKNGSPLENEPAIRKRPCNKRKHRTSTNDNPLGSDTPPEDGSPLENEPAIRKRPCHKQKHRASKDGNPLGSDSAPKDGSPLEREPLTRKRKPRSGSNKEKNNPKRRK